MMLLKVKVNNVYCRLFLQHFSVPINLVDLLHNTHVVPVYSTTCSSEEWVLNAIHQYSTLVSQTDKESQRQRN